MKQRLLNLGKGHPDETISSRAGKAALLKWQTAEAILTPPITI